MPTCEYCLTDKTKRKPFRKGTRTKTSLQWSIFYICDPMSVKARYEALYFITFIDDFTRYGHVYMLCHKSEVLDCFRHYINLVENQLDKKIKT